VLTVHNAPAVVLNEVIQPESWCKLEYQFSLY
jgi:hypothetical protein